MALSAPLVDHDNPLYCPEVTAHQYLSSIRLFQASVADASRFPYFNRMCNAFTDNNSPDFQRSMLTNTCSLSMAQQGPDGCNDDSLTENTIFNNRKRQSHKLSSSVSDTFQSYPTKRFKRSSSSHIDMSFVLSAKAERLCFPERISQLPSSGDKFVQNTGHPACEELFWPEELKDNVKHFVSVETGTTSIPGRARALEGDKIPCISGESLKKSSFDSDVSFLPPPPPKLKPCYWLVTESTKNDRSEAPASVLELLRHLEKLLPGVRLQSQLDASISTHQDIVNLLGLKGHLNPCTLSLFHHTQIQSLILTESMADADGLNLLRHDTLKVLNNPASFLSLRSIVLSDVPLDDDDLACLGNLQSLEVLFLDDTRIGDIAVMHLIQHRRSLSHLELSWNDRITDDAIPTFCNLSSLSFLSLKGTGVTMKGLRRLACSAKDRDKKINIILPSECEEYMCNLHNEYGAVLSPPLIHDPDACHTLSHSALKENLVAHGARNPAIMTKGTRAELERQLRKILMRRQKDMIVQGFMLQGFV